SETPTIVVPNGGTGTLFDGQIRPFVTGFVPVVGGGAPATVVSPLAERLSRLQSEQALQASAAERAAAEAEAKAAAAPPPAPRKDDPPLVLGVER
ncbi:MAG: hypothetical protein KY475_24640, partial [Planctomycetes bacterium]|nr:hypothetical protein [Planctomycetota bacterium]